jgi:hypothetical protein
MRDGAVIESEDAYPIPDPGALLNGSGDTSLASAWSKASASQFTPA